MGDCSEDEANKTSIEVNVKIPPSMQPRQLKNNIPKINVPRRVSPGRFNPIAAQELATPPQTNMPRLRPPPPHLVAAQKAAAIASKINARTSVTEAFDNENDENVGPLKSSYPDLEYQNALELVSKELGRYKLTSALKSEGTYWLTLVNEGVPKWGLVDAEEDPEQEKLNDAAIQELMNDAKKRNNAAQVEGI